MRTNDFRLIGLDPSPFTPLYGRDERELAALGVSRHVVDVAFAFPDRVTLRDLEIGETALLLNYVHQPAPGPYRASHAIFIGERPAPRYDVVGEVPPALRRRVLSLRAFSASGEMLDADLVDGTGMESLANRFLSDARVAYVHAHYAKRGCYAALIERAKPFRAREHSTMRRVKNEDGRRLSSDGRPS